MATLLCLMNACTEKRNWYVKEYPDEDKPTLATQLRRHWGYYQGTVPEQFHLHEAMRLDSTNADLWRELGTARVKRGLADEMYYYYGKASEKKPEKWAGFRGYLYLYFYRDYQRAINDFDLSDSVEGTVGHSQGQDHDYMRGLGYYGLKNYVVALGYLDKYIKRVTKENGEDWVDVYAILYKGLTLIKLDRFDEAIVEFDRALKYYPNLSDCFYHKAKIYLSQNDLAAARSNMLKAKEHFEEGYFHKRPYIEPLEQIYIQDIEKLQKEIEQRTYKVI